MKEVKSIRLGQKEGYFCKKIAVGSCQKARSNESSEIQFIQINERSEIQFTQINESNEIHASLNSPNP